MSEAVDPALSQIVGGTSKVISEKELEKKLEEGTSFEDQVWG
jgi:hypothetical protein